MPLIQQNFTLAAGDQVDISLDIGPDIASMVGTNLTFRVYEQQVGVSIGDALIVKNLDEGLQISDPDYGIVVISFDEEDTSAMTPRNYNFEVTTYDTDDIRITVSQGVMTLTRTMNPTSEDDL